MLQIDVKLNPVADEGSMDRVINRMMGTHNSKPMVGEHTSPSDNAEQEFQQKIENTSETMDNFDDVMSKLKDSFKDVLGSIKALAGDLDNLDQKLPAALQKARKDDPKGTTKDLAEYKKDVNGVVGVAGQATNAIGFLANGNVGGLLSSGMQYVSNQQMNKSKLASDEGDADLAKKLLIGGGIAAIAGLTIKGADTLANKYQDALPGMDSLNQMFGGDNINNLTAKQNSENALRMRDRASDAAKGTGLTNEDFVQLATSLGAYGVNDESRAFSIARSAGNWSRYTGAESSQIANFAGLMERYGGNGEQSIEQAYKAARVSGLDKSQFGEFLTGLQSVVENGISKGFIKSADDVSESLANISLLSGNSELWSGKNGIQRYQQMSDSMGNATSLNSTSSMLLYQAMANTKENQGKNWIDVMSAIEKGDWADLSEGGFLESYKNTLNGAYGNDREQQIATIKENFGLNWTGAKDFYENVLSKVGTGEISEAEVQERMNAYKTDPKYQSDSTKMTDALNKIDKALVGFGKNIGELKIAGLSGIATAVDGIYSFLTKDKTPAPIPEASGGAYGSGYTQDQVDAYTSMYETSGVGGIMGINKDEFDSTVNGWNPKSRSTQSNERNRIKTVWENIVASGNVEAQTQALNEVSIYRNPNSKLDHSSFNDENIKILADKLEKIYSTLKEPMTANMN